LILSRQRLLLRVSPTATAGRLGAYAYDPTSRTFAMVATSSAAGQRGNRSTDTVIFIPSTVHGAVHVTGAAAVDAVTTRPDASRLAYIRTTKPGSARYGVTVGQAPSALTSRVAAEAATPLQPISEQEARAMAESALDAETHSPDAAIRSTAQLVKGLAGIVLGSSDPNAPSTS
jgi:hypothetical protein